MNKKLSLQHLLLLIL